MALMAQGWLWWRAWVLCSSQLFAWQAWHLATSTCILCGRRGPWRHRHAVCMACVALMALGWLWWRLGPLVAAAVCVAYTWLLTTSTFTLRGRHGTFGTGLALVARLGPLVAAAVCVPYVTLDDMDLHFAWQAWHLTTSTCILRGRCGPWRHRPSLCAAGVALGDIENNTFTRNPFAHLTWICISCTHRSSTISCLFPALPIPSSPFFGYLLEEVDMWGYPVL